MNTHSLSISKLNEKLKEMSFKRLKLINLQMPYIEYDSLFELLHDTDSFIGRLTEEKTIET